MELRELFDTLITALEENKTELLDDVFASDAVVDTTALGTFKGIEEIKKGLAWKGEKLDAKKIRVFNNVLRADETDGCEYAYLYITLGKEINDFMNIFQCAFLTVTDYKKIDGNWKIVSFKARMTFECGNTLLVANNWKMIDYGKLEGSDHRPIDGHKDSPFNKIKNDVLVKDDEQKIKEVFWRYNWSIDADCYDEFPQFTTDGIAIAAAGQKTNVDFATAMRAKRFRNIEEKGLTIPKEACWNHISTFQSIKIDGDKATTEILRLEPNRIGSKFFSKYNLDTVFYTATWKNDFVKENGEWKMASFNYVSGIVESKDNQERYF